MSPSSRRFFGCLLPLALAIYGCGACAMLGYASQIFVQIEPVTDGAMAPILEEGWDVVVDNTAHWLDEPKRGTVVLIERPEGRVFRRIVGLPGETVAIEDGRVQVDGQVCDGATLIHGQLCSPGGGAAAAGVDLAARTLAPAEYFVLSEDWAVADSRRWGPVAREQIFGNPIFRRMRDGGFAPILRAEP